MSEREGEYAPEFECQECGLRMSDDGADSLLRWVRDQDGELSFCPSCAKGELSSPPSNKVLSRLHRGAARYKRFKDFLYAHREGALECHDHPGHYCCVCGEHMALGYHEHLAALLAKLAFPAAAHHDQDGGGE